MKDKIVYPVIDLFAGPGGLGEGFASLRHPGNSNNYAFRTAISIEKDPSAHRTLKLRHFYRELTRDTVPDDYYHYLAGTISLEELYCRHPEAASHAEHTAWLCTLGKEPRENVKGRISEALKGQKKWVLVGGPPCQAYSLVGRSRMSGNPEFESDPRHLLYKEYLQILADHTPPAFVMENVKGLLSSTINGALVIHDILRDLSKPAAAFGDENSRLAYRLYSLAQSGVMSLDADPGAFVVKAEEYGIPQARHRIFIVGIRSDIDIRPRTLEKSAMCTTVRNMIGDLPRIRSGISKTTDSGDSWVRTLTAMLHQPWFIHGRENGRADLARLTEQTLEVLRQHDLKKSSTDYSLPAELTDWFRDNRLTTLTSHEARSHMESDLRRYFFAALYASLKNSSPRLSHFPDELLPAHKNVGGGVSGKLFSDRFRVQLPDAPSTTITSHISKDGHYYIHYDPTQCRSLTVREAARLQTFPDNYKFEGNRTAQYHQVGNAVPPLLANRIAEIVLEVLEAME